VQTASSSIAIAHLRQLRVLFDRIVDSMSEKDLFTVPDGFSNHVAWNVAHVVVTQQLLHYGLSGIEPTVPADLIGSFRKGTRAGDGSAEAFRATREHIHSAVERLSDDYEAGRFERFEEYTTSAGITLASFEDALAFNNIHEGIHLGYVMALRKGL